MDNSSSNEIKEGDSADQQKNTDLSEPLLETRRRELEQARVEYYSIKEDTQKKKKFLDSFSNSLDKAERIYDDWYIRRDEINQDLRDKRKEIKNLEITLQTARTDLEELELTAKNVRRETTQAKKNLEKTLSNYELLEDNYAETEDALELTIEDLKAAQVAFRLAGGKLPKDQILFASQNTPWKSGSFYLTAAVVIIILFAVVSVNLPWYVVAIVFIGGILTLAVIGALQLRNDENLTEENFLKLMIETFTRLPLLKDGSTSSEAKENQS